MMNICTNKRIGACVGVALMSFYASAAQALLLDNSQQKVVYIGRGDAQNMQAVKVQEIPNQPTYTYSQTTTYQPAGFSAYSAPAYTQPAQSATNPYSTYSDAYTQGFGLDRLALRPSSAAVAVFDLQTGQPIYEKNVNSKRSIASITKVMTAMVLLDANLDMREEITLIGSDLVGAKKASTNLRAGDRMSRSEFILLMLMKSENPAAKALARTYPGGYDAFISAMNHKAYSLGMSQTSFSDSSGLNPRNVSSANDLIKMMRAVNSDPRYQMVRNFSTAQSYDFYINNYNSGSRTYKANNTSRLVRSGSYPIGASKTGYIREAGYCVVMETHVNNRPAVVVLLGASASNNRWNDAENILTQLAFLN
ncbi:MAG: serine hydrolase [Moraxella sp.]|nr:serine hydrolase [Moraxella sp.]